MKVKVNDIIPPCDDYSKKRGGCVEKKEGRSGGKKGLFFFLFLLVFAVAGYFYYTSYGTEVVLYPNLEVFQDDVEVLVKTTGALGGNEIRGVVLTERVTDTREFDIEGRRLVEEKAEGEIRVCQDYRDSAVNFVEGTRFVSDEGKFFLAKEGFTLPARANNNGCADVLVVAAEAGEEYNVSSNSNFVLPGLEGSATYSRVEGVSFELKKEGVLEEVPYLDDETMERAERQMEESLLEKGKNLLLEEHGEEYLLKSDAQFVINILEKTFDEDSFDDSEEKFNFQLTAEVKTIAKSKENLDNFIKSLLPEGKTWRKETESIDITFSRINLEEEEASALLNISLETYDDFNKETVRRDLAGMDFAEAIAKIEEEMNMEEVEVFSRPFGLSRVVNDASRVRIVLGFDKS